MCQLFVKLIIASISMYITCVILYLFNVLSRRVGALEMSTINTILATGLPTVRSSVLTPPRSADQDRTYFIVRTLLSIATGCPRKRRTDWLSSTRQNTRNIVSVDSGYKRKEEENTQTTTKKPTATIKRKNYNIKKPTLGWKVILATEEKPPLSSSLLQSLSSMSVR